MPVFLHQKQMYMLMKRPHTLRNYKKKRKKVGTKYPGYVKMQCFQRFFSRELYF